MPFCRRRIQCDGFWRSCFGGIIGKNRGKAELLPMPADIISKDTVEMGALRGRFLFGGFVERAKEKKLSALLDDDRVEQILRQAIGEKFDKADKVRILTAMLNPSEKFREILRKNLFEYLRPFTWNQILEVAEIVTKAVGGSA